MVRVVFGLLVLLIASLQTNAQTSVSDYTCEGGTLMTSKEREKLLSKLRISKAGRALIQTFESQYSSLDNLIMHWNEVSFSQVATPTREVEKRTRAIASANTQKLGGGICIHLSKKLPEIEHIADFAHELAHATRLEARFFRGEVEDVEEFVRTRLTARGGEADAFAVECEVKHELLGSFDSLCGPYAAENGKGIDIKLVIRDLYNGQLSASLTGEPYPVMLSRQYKAMLERRAVRQTLKQSALENKSNIQ